MRYPTVHWWAISFPECATQLSTDGLFLSLNALPNCPLMGYFSPWMRYPTVHWWAISLPECATQLSTDGLFLSLNAPPNCPLMGYLFPWMRYPTVHWWAVFGCLWWSQTPPFKTVTEGMFYLTTHSTHFVFRLYGVRHMIKDYSDNDRGNPLPPHGLLFLIISKGSFIWRSLLHQLWNTGWNEKSLNGSTRRPIAPLAKALTTEKQQGDELQLM